MDFFLGEIRPVPYNYAPVGWALCQGQLLPIQQNTGLFSLLGSQFGGNGTTNFALPDLRGRVPLGAGPGPGYDYSVGEEDGVESVGLSGQEMASHAHGINVSQEIADQTSPGGNLPAVAANFVYDGTGKATFNPGAIMPTGDGLPHPNIQPYTAINYMIALTGIYPQKS